MILVILLFLVGLATGYLLHKFVLSMRLESVKSLSEKMLQTAEKDALHMKEKAKTAAVDIEKIASEKTVKIQNDLKQKEQELKLKTREVSSTLLDLEKKEKELRKKSENQKIAEESCNQLLVSHKLERERIANLSQEKAKEELFALATSQIEGELKKVYAKKFQEVEESVEREARRLIVTSICRISQSQVPDSSTTLISLPNDEIKSKIIGRDGKNIRAFEEITGVTLIIDDTPLVIFLSCFDPLRRHIAKLTLSELLADGKINPMTIEKAFQRNEQGIEQNLINLGKDAEEKAQLSNLHFEILKLLGKLHFRTSLGQNVLSHSIEVSHIMGMLAAELKLNSTKAKRIGLLHDIGKACPQEAGLSHALIGKRIALQYGESEDIANGIGCHHDEIAPTSFEAGLCKAADTISAIRPGARSDNIEKHVKKLTLLEEIAKEFTGVENAYAIQAGREIRVFVKPEVIDDVQAIDLARQIAKKIEASSASHGKVQVTIVREKKVTDFALQT
jgi:ribonucrease Y